MQNITASEASRNNRNKTLYTISIEDSFCQTERFESIKNEDTNANTTPTAVTKMLAFESKALICDRRLFNISFFEPFLISFVYRIRDVVVQFIQIMVVIIC